MRRAGRKDYNHQAIVAALRAIGVVVQVVNHEGLPDLLTFHRGQWLPIEIKRPRGRLTKDQAALRQVAPFPVVYSVSEALALFGVRAEGIR